ncbi:MarR family winged helix-turn-helix transcriptional regulator [Leifsonia poae]|uniref:MarR family winged helix-turn-helix transcriptional regulator n=1 Tax=Leifsonia poae TaxID=110933 RepID=UPI001CBB804C|nr:MarR family transcriptional regulator [Leifsonia poae]
MTDDPLETAVLVRRGVSSLSRVLRGKRPSRLSLNKLSVLGHLYRAGPLAMGALAAADGVQPQALTRVAAQLEEAGLVDRTTDPLDRRRSLLQLTERGVEALGESMRPRDEWLAVRLADLSPTERGVLRLAAALLDELAAPSPDPAAARVARVNE